MSNTPRNSRFLATVLIWFIAAGTPLERPAVAKTYETAIANIECFDNTSVMEQKIQDSKFWLTDWPFELPGLRVIDNWWAVSFKLYRGELASVQLISPHILPHQLGEFTLSNHKYPDKALELIDEVRKYFEEKYGPPHESFGDEGLQETIENDRTISVRHKWDLQNRVIIIYIMDPIADLGESGSDLEAWIMSVSADVVCFDAEKYSK